MLTKERGIRRKGERENTIRGLSSSIIRHLAGKHGVALMMTLWILVILTVIAMNFSFSTRYGSMGTRNFKTDTRAYYLAVSAYEEALLYLLSDKEPKVDFIDEDGNFRTDAEREPITGIKELDGAEVSLSISDEESRLNINVMKRDLLLKLLELADVPDDSKQIIADSIADWIDQDDLHHLSGAEDEHYGPLGYRAKNNPMDVPEELLLIRGFLPEYLFEDRKESLGAEESVPMHALITTWGEGINVNTAPANVLRLLGLDADEVDSILSQRKEQGISSIPKKLQGIGTIKSNHFRITAEARLNDSPLSVRITSVVKRATLPEEPPLKTIYWKEELDAPALLKKDQEDLESTGA
jgi:general secretion pathway protein K